MLSTTLQLLLTFYCDMPANEARVEMLRDEMIEETSDTWELSESELLDMAAEYGYEVCQ